MARCKFGSEPRASIFNDSNDCSVPRLARSRRWQRVVMQWPG